MKKFNINIKDRSVFSYVIFCFLALGILTASCSSDDDFKEVEDSQEKLDSKISFDPNYFGQSFYTAPDSTHLFTVKINKGLKAATGFTVYEKIISEGVLIQDRTELSEYRRQLNDEDLENFEISYHVSEDRLNNDKITLDFVVEQEDKDVSEALVIEVQKSAPPEEPVQPINDIIYYTQLALGAQDNNDFGSYFNIETTTDYKLPEATNNQEKIDFAMLVGASTGINFLSPASSGFKFFGAALKDAVHDGWSVKNEGQFVNIGNLPSSEAIFDNLEYAADIIAAYNQAEADVANMPGYVENENGPGDRIRQVNVGDIIFFKSGSGTIAVLQITMTLPDTAGKVEFKMKTAADPDAEPMEPVEDELAYFPEIELGGQEHASIGSYFNIVNQTVYSLDDATANQSMVDFIMLFGASTGVNFVTPGSSGMKFFGADLKTAIFEGWSVKNDGQFVNIGNNDTAGVFDGLSTEDDLSQAYQTAVAEVANMDDYVANENGPGDRIRQVKVGDVIFFETESGTQVALKITQLAEGTSDSVTFEMKTVK